MSEDSGDAGRIRASDAEREEYARMVREAVTEGRLNLSEGDERLAQVYAAAYRDELPPTVTDLPRPAGGPWGRPTGAASTGGRPWGAGRGYGRRAWHGDTLADGPGERGEWRGERGGWRGERGEWRGGRMCGLGWGGFGRHLAFVLIVAAVLITIWAATAASFFWPVIPLAFLALGLVKHGAWLRWAGRRRGQA